jgi:hypothetical protein
MLLHKPLVDRLRWRAERSIETLPAWRRRAIHSRIGNSDRHPASNLGSPLMRAVLAFLLASLGFAAAAQANLIYALGGSNVILNPEGETQVVLMMSGDDYYTDSNLRMQINGGVGPAPSVTAVFGDVGGLIAPASLYDGSIWEGGSAGIALPPEGTSPTSSGRKLTAGFATPAITSQNTAGVYALLTISTVGVPFGNYALSLNGTDLWNGLNSEGEPIPVPLQFAPITLIGGTVPPPQPELTATPTPGSRISFGVDLPLSTPVELAHAITVSNTGEAPLILEDGEFVGPDAALFSLFGAIEDLTLDPGESATLAVRFNGAPQNGEYRAWLEYRSNAEAWFGYGLTARVGPEVKDPLIPEPSTYALAVSGLAALLLVRRRRRDTNSSQTERHS